MFRVGQKVVRVSGERHPSEYSYVNYPPLNAPVTVANFYVAENGVDMVEIIEFPCPETDERYAGFRARHFRPVVDRPTDISIFTRMLIDADEKVEA